MKPKVLSTLAEARAKEAELEAMCADEPADPTGRWHPKDHLAHSAWWRQRNAQLFDAVRTGSEPPPSVNDDTQNDVIYRSHRDTPLTEIQERARSSWDQLIDVAEALSEEDLMKPHPYAPDQQLWQEVCGTSFFHLGEHLTYVYEDAGDDKRAEAAQRWMRDLHYGVAVDDRQRGTAEYNLGCFYAKRGRAEEALPLLRKGIALRPDLADWAKKDSDLDPIRDNASIKEFVG